MMPLSRRLRRTSAKIAAALAFGLAIAAPAHAQNEPSNPAAPSAADRPAVNSVFGSLSVSFVELGGRDRTWSLASGGVTLNTSTDGLTTAEVQRTARPGLENLRGSLRHDDKLGENTNVYVQVSASSGDPLREDWGVGAGIVQRLGKQLQLTLDVRAARYSTPDPAAARPSFVGLAVNPGVILTPRGTPLEVSAHAIILRNDRKEWQLGAAMRALYYTGDRDFFLAGVSRYPENELGVVRQLTTVYAGFRRDLGKGIGLRITAEQAWLQNAWEASTINVGLEKRF